LRLQREPSLVLHLHWGIFIVLEKDFYVFFTINIHIRRWKESIRMPPYLMDTVECPEILPIEPKPITPYLAFCKEMRPIIHQEFPALRPSEITKEIARRWRAKQKPFFAKETLTTFFAIVTFCSVLYTGWHGMIFSPNLSTEPPIYPMIAISDIQSVGNEIHLFVASTFSMIAVALLGIFS